MRSLALSMVVICVLATSAAADKEIILLGPVASGKLAAAKLRTVKVAVDAAAVVPSVPRDVDAACINDAVCVAGIGSALTARRVVGMTVAQGRGATLTIGLVLVDVPNKELIGKRDVAVVERRLARDLGPAIKKFVDEMPVERAKALFGQGKQHYDLGEFPQALELYKAAYRIKPLAAFLFNIAQCHRKLEQHSEAIAMYQSYLVAFPNADNKAMVESLMNESKAKIAEAKAAEDRKAAEARRLEEMRIAAEKKKAEDERMAKEAEARTAEEKRKAEQARIAAERERELDKTYNRHPARKWALLAGGIGIAAAGAGGYFGYQTRQAQTRFDDAGCGDPARLLTEAAYAQCNEDRDLGKSRATLTNIFLGAGGALLVTSALIFAIDPGNIDRPEKPKVVVTPTSVQVVLQW